MKYGYARVSTDDQTTALQRAALTRAGCKTIFKDEGLSGATTSSGLRKVNNRCVLVAFPVATGAQAGAKFP